MKNLFKTAMILGLAVILNSCGAATIDETESQQKINFGPGQHLPYRPTVDNHSIFRAPNGAIYNWNELYRDQFGRLYNLGIYVGNDNVMNQPRVIARNGKLLPVDPRINQQLAPSDSGNEEGSNSQGVNVVVSDNSFQNIPEPTNVPANTAQPQPKRSGSNTPNSYTGGFK